jgi:HTH-type transcriptional regulator / antitoxin HigA
LETCSILNLKPGQFRALCSVISISAFLSSGVKVCPLPHYTALLEQLDRKGSKLTAAEQRLADLLTLLIEDFEERHYALKPATPVGVLEELMAANELKQKDLLDIFGTASIISEVLGGKRKLTTEHIRKLSRRFHVSPEMFF